jgi:hypothetical protein
LVFRVKSTKVLYFSYGKPRDGQEKRIEKIIPILMQDPAKWFLDLWPCNLNAQMIELKRLWEG